MKATNIPFSIKSSDARIRSMLELTDSAFTETEQIPASARLTYENGFFVECARKRYRLRQ